MNVLEQPTSGNVLIKGRAWAAERERIEKAKRTDWNDTSAF